MTQITPTIGRRIHFFAGPDAQLPGNFQRNGDGGFDAGIVYVWSEKLVNLDVCDHNGTHHPFTSVEILGPGDPKPSAGFWAEWMGYQIGQAAKTEDTARLAVDEKIARQLHETGWEDRIAALEEQHFAPAEVTEPDPMPSEPQPNATAATRANYDFNHGDTVEFVENNKPVRGTIKRPSGDFYLVNVPSRPTRVRVHPSEMTRVQSAPAATGRTGEGPDAHATGPGEAGEGVVPADKPARITAGARVFLNEPHNGVAEGVVTDAPPDDGRYLIELTGGEQVWKTESEIRGAQAP